MKKRIHCGLCSQTLNGLKLRKVPALEGGGVRSIPWDKTDLTFAEVHEQFRGKFKLGKMSLHNRILHFSLFLIDSDERTSIYDFQLNLLDLNRYNTFKDYIDDYGLTGKTTAIHLFLHNSGREFFPFYFYNHLYLMFDLKVIRTSRKSKNHLHQNRKRSEE